MIDLFAFTNFCKNTIKPTHIQHFAGILCIFKTLCIQPLCVQRLLVELLARNADAEERIIVIDGIGGAHGAENGGKLLHGTAVVAATLE